MPDLPGVQYRRILVATGGAAHSEVATQRAAHLALQFSAPLHIVSVIPQGRPGLENVTAAFAGSSDLDGRVTQDTHQRINRHLHSTAADARSLGLDVHEHLITALKPADAILSVAREVDADLIVLGRRHTSAWSAALAGSVADMVSHASPVDVLVAR
ncbi:universal stress protein [Deinococcus radiotolerans]|uniref:Universal stress protein n=1 Tax=Deinococcus radiotolerans TaxID=1309407 RepID=A0ABQ2FRF5_9DEIO|nr:universal stress protein [Deinococcus radiotolerans]GGL19547.1 universal stress protein [Deinococcus radiotolerans]